MAKRKKKGHVAIPFLVALLIGILVIGGIAMYLFRLIGLNDVNVVPMKESIVVPTESDNMTLLFVLDEESDPKPVTILVARVLPAEKKIVLLSFPSNTLCAVDGHTDTLAGYYTSGGINTLKNAIQTESGIVVDRYMILDSEAFQKICNIYTGVYYTVPSGTKGFSDSAEPQYLGPGQMEKLVTYPFFTRGETERSAVVADIICEMINQTDHDRIVSSMDNNFKILVNMADTDITSIDYSNERTALKYLYTYGKRIASFRIATGTSGEEDEDVFLLKSDFYQTVEDVFGTPGATAAPPAEGETDGENGEE